MDLKIYVDLKKENTIKLKNIDGEDAGFIFTPNTNVNTSSLGNFFESTLDLFEETFETQQTTQSTSTVPRVWETSRSKTRI